MKEQANHQTPAAPAPFEKAGQLIADSFDRMRREIDADIRRLRNEVAELRTEIHGRRK